MDKDQSKIGEILVRQGLLSSGKLELALEIQKTSGEFFGSVVIKKGWVTESQFLSALSKQYDIPYLEIQLDDVDWDVATQHVSALMAGGCFPFRQDQGSVSVAISNPLDAWTMSLIESKSRGRVISLFLTTQSKIDQLVFEFRKIAISHQKKDWRDGIR